MRSARAEAYERVGGRWDVRVLEPSPPAIADAPYAADDPLAGGEVLPIEREGSRSWEDVCRGEPDRSLRRWCEERWLVRRKLAPLPETFALARAALHAVAEHVLAPARFAVTGKIGLRYTLHGFGTPFFGADRQWRVDDGALVDEEGRRIALTTLGEAVAFAGVEGAATGVYEPTTPADPVTVVEVDPTAARSLGDWFGYCTSLLEQLRADATVDDAATRVQLWPEHFDIAVDIGRETARANYGGSPGDEAHPEPYLYVGPWERREGPFWNEPFGASLSYGDLLAGADGLAFLRRGRALLAGRE